MESINKFKVLTIIILCMFVFVVAAIYTNTKDESAKKGNQQVKLDKQYRAPNEQNLNDLALQVDALNRRMEDMTDRINQLNSDSGEIKCKIYGTMSYNGLERMSSEDAIEDAKANGNTLILACSL